MDSLTKPTRVRDLVWREIDGEIAIISPENKHLHTFNNVGSNIWKMLDGKNDLDAITDKVASKYGQSLSVVKKDVSEFINDLDRLNLIEVK